MVDAQPVRWDNISEVTVDSLRAQVARFRTGSDSVDVFIAVNPPYAEVAASTEIRGTPRLDFWLLRGGTVTAHHDSVMLTQPGMRTWTPRVPPGTYVYRAELSVDGGTRAARSVATLVTSDDPLFGIGRRGFGMSDLLLAAGASPRRGTPGRRWSELDIQPITGTIAPRGELTLVWENYDFGRDSVSGLSRYQVTVTIQQARARGGRVAARILGGIASVIGVDRTDDKMSISFERESAHAAAYSDHIGIALEDSPPGDYSLSISITDRVTGRTLLRTAGFTIAR
jgi:hypothetical protein